MRSRIIKFIMLLSVIATIASCRDESTFYDPDDPTKNDTVVDSTNIGYLSIPDFEVIVDTSAEELVDSSTRSGDSSKDNYWVTINSTNLKIPVEIEVSYGEFLSKVTSDGGYPLQAGDYTIAVATEKIDDQTDQVEQVVIVGADGADLGYPVYTGAQSFTITKGVTTTVDDIVCKLSNVAVSLSLSADLKALFKPDEDCSGSDIPLSVDITLGKRTYTFSRLDYDKIAYFNIADGSKNEIELELSGMYNTSTADQTPSYSEIEGWKQTISNVEGGQWRKIAISVLHANEGNIEFEVTVESWVYDDVIDVNIMSLYASKEEVILDPEQMPKIVLDGSYNNSLFIAGEGDVDPMKFIITPRNKETMSSVVISEQTILNNEQVEFWPIDAANPFSVLFNIEEDPNSKILTLTATDECMAQLRDLPEDVKGVAYNFSVNVADSRDYLSSATYQVVVGEVVPPQIVWEGYDLNTRYEISAADEEVLPVILDITSDTGISEFLVQINSELLTPEELGSVNLAQNMDLINPGDLEEGLVALGFPIGDQVLGARELEFNIIKFIPLLAGLGAGDSDFVLTVTNSAGGTTSVTIKLRVVE